MGGIGKKREEYMEKFIIGALCGGIVGALAVSNNAKMRALVKKERKRSKRK